jgi:ribose transport system substrate-binding protein
MRRPIRRTASVRTAAVALVLTLVGTAGCSRMSTTHTADKKNPTIGVTVYNMSSFITLGQQGVNTEAKALGAKVLWRSANNDVNTQASQIQAFVQQKVDAILVAAVNASTLSPQIKAAQQAGIPVFAVNLELDQPAAAELKAYVGPDDAGAGAQEAKYLAEGLGGHGNVVVMQGPIGSSAEIDRTKGIDQELAEYPGIHVLATQPANWDRNQAYTLMQNWLSSFGTRIDGVVSENDDMGIGAIRALDAAGRSDVKVVGIDGIQDGMKAVQAKQLYESNLQDAPLELGTGVAVAVDYLRGEAIPTRALLEMPPLTSSTVAKYYQQMYADPSQFLSGLPQLIAANLKSGDYADQ